ncbi:hypothetical protein HOP38_13125 [Vibrio mediterranei]|uniref:hypothetical protein n=1 Tax=Vibrio mediterranei TaxID=689 RepID=UPI0017BA2C1D|nr:hypothetical protein [Vibrio mediterranei]NUW73468.1 hypothetical protein [Vibrio mediterranei]
MLQMQYPNNEDLLIDTPVIPVRQSKSRQNLHLTAEQSINNLLFTKQLTGDMVDARCI